MPLRMVTTYELVVNGIPDETDLAGQVTSGRTNGWPGVSAIVHCSSRFQGTDPALLRAKEAGIIVVNIDNKLDQTIHAESKAAFRCRP